MYIHTVKQLCQYISSLCSLHKQLYLFIAAPVTSIVHVMRENYTAATVKDLPAPPPVENIRNKKCQVSLSLVMFLLKSSVVSSLHLKLCFLTTAADLYKPRLFHVTCLQLFSLHLRNSIQKKKQVYNLMLSPLIHQQDLRR